MRLSTVRCHWLLTLNGRASGNPSSFNIILILTGNQAGMPGNSAASPMTWRWLRLMVTFCKGNPPPLGVTISVSLIEARPSRLEFAGAADSVASLYSLESLSYEEVSSSASFSRLTILIWSDLDPNRRFWMASRSLGVGLMDIFLFNREFGWRRLTSVFELGAGCDWEDWTEWGEFGRKSWFFDRAFIVSGTLKPFPPTWALELKYLQFWESASIFTVGDDKIERGIAWLCVVPRWWRDCWRRNELRWKTEGNRQRTTYEGKALSKEDLQHYIHSTIQISCIHFTRTV